MPVRPDMLPRQDSVPDRNSGRRTICAPDRKIRIFVRVVGASGRLALWVDPDLPVGPCQHGPQNRFTDMWGHDAEARGPCAGKPQPDASGRLTPFRSLLAAQDEETQRQQRSLGQGGIQGDDCTAHEQSVATLAGLSSVQEGTSQMVTACDSSTFSVGAVADASLKEFIEAATGVPVDRQKLTFGRVGLLDDHRRGLCEYDIGHGALLYLAVRPERGGKKEQKFLASPARVRDQDSHAAWRTLETFMRSKTGSKTGKDLAESLPDWVDSVSKPRPPTVDGPQEPYYNKFTLVMHGISPHDTSDAIRGRFAQTQRAAAASAASRRLPALAPAPAPA